MNGETTAKFTPGPWFVSRHGYEVFSRADVKGICWTAGNNKQRTPEAQANARLIAEAPAMYDLLKVLNDVCEYDGDISASMWQAIEAIPQAIEAILTRIDGGSR